MKNKTLKKGDWDEAKIKRKIKENHEQEDSYNREIGNIDKQIKKLKTRKQALVKMVSKNMKYRNLIISFLPQK